MNRFLAAAFLILCGAGGVEAKRIWLTGSRQGDLAMERETALQAALQARRQTLAGYGVSMQSQRDGLLDEITTRLHEPHFRTGKTYRAGTVMRAMTFRGKAYLMHAEALQDRIHWTRLLQARPEEASRLRPLEIAADIRVVALETLMLERGWADADVEDGEMRSNTQQGIDYYETDAPGPVRQDRRAR